MSSRLTFSYQSLLIQRKVNFERIKLNKIGGENKDKREFEQHFPKMNHTRDGLRSENQP